MLEFIDHHLLEGLHIISVVTWLSILLTLPRLFLHHSRVPSGSNRDLLMQSVENSLYKYVGNLAGSIVILLGGMLVVQEEIFSSGELWIHVKILCVFGLVVHHILCGKYINDFSNGINNKSELFWKVFHMIPGILMICIILLVMIRPF